MNRKKLLVVFVSYGPRHLAKAAVLQRHAPDTFFLGLAGAVGKYPWEKGSEKFPVHLFTLFPAQRQEDLSRLAVFPKVLQTLNEIQPDVVIYHGLLAPGFQALALWTKINRVPAILHFDSWQADKARVSWQQSLKGHIYKYFFDYAFVAGKHSRDYLISMGYPQDRIAVGCDVVDNKYFRDKSSFYKNSGTCRESEGLPENFFLMPSRYAAEKDHATLLRAYNKYRASGGDWKLVMIGEGPLKHEILNMIEALQLNDDVIQKGWISYEKIPLYYAYAGCLILPSRSEPWGLVANEAAACGLPLILSNKCGCVPELCVPGANGFVFEAGDSEELAQYMKKISDGSVDLAAMGAKSQELVSPFSLESWAGKVLALKNLCLGKEKVLPNPSTMKVF